MLRVENRHFQDITRVLLVFRNWLEKKIFVPLVIDIFWNFRVKNRNFRGTLSVLGLLWIWLETKIFPPLWVLDMIFDHFKKTSSTQGKLSIIRLRLAFIIILNRFYGIWVATKIWPWISLFQRGIMTLTLKNKIFAPVLVWGQFVG